MKQIVLFIALLFAPTLVQAQTGVRLQCYDSAASPPNQWVDCNATYAVPTTVQNAASITIGSVSQNGTWTVQPGNTANTTPWLANSNLAYPSGATALAAAGAGTTGAVTATLAATSGKTTYICGFDVSAIGGVATIGPITVATLVGSTTFTYQLASTATGVTLNKTFTPCIPATSTNATIVVTTTADGTASAVDVNAWGFQL